MHGSVNRACLAVWMKEFLRAYFGSLLAFAKIALALVCLSQASKSLARNFNNAVPMHDKGASTYYVPCSIEGYGNLDMLVDTGSAYTTINEEALGVLKQQGLATFIKDLKAKLADGSYRVVPVYRIATINVGDDCEIEDVEAAVLPGKTRSMLGLSALNKAGPFIFSIDPPQLSLSNCGKEKYPRVFYLRGLPLDADERTVP